MKLLSVNLVDSTKLEVLLEDSASAAEVFNFINFNKVFNAKTLDGEVAEVFINSAKFSGFVLSNYEPPISQEVVLEAMSEYEKTVQMAEDFFKFEGDDGIVYSNDGTPLE